MCLALFTVAALSKKLVVILAVIGTALREFRILSGNPGSDGLPETEPHDNGGVGDKNKL